MLKPFKINIMHNICTTKAGKNKKLIHGFNGKQHFVFKSTREKKRFLKRNGFNSISEFIKSKQ